ncbi:hypothetical protein RI578_42550 (plasmid) [Streptomyces sp. BB1-1-1]|uniref:hypothetical protein n=1 Tax=Streptomyces sp. BB1-1-1 TaxID=3074430 RepID=UPI002877EECB|nr:hypothetical protein [Streptomyces sp. BB1-1-1]WND32810.1 hypothetical protein RI578_00080 [Streptomyces sp. BB1-1-1]WND40122.1 hypothetical protein RI578_40325 [Streptomyces sp. BB1-1-1]WND40954.1 hypothetical protein RI578_42550 [Streptomyces sp. BB1-1-1]
MAGKMGARHEPLQTSARAYLCGIGDMAYLDEAPFAAQAITVTPFRPPTAPIWSSGCRLSALWVLSALSPQTVAARLRALAADHTVLQSAA